MTKGPASSTPPDPRPRANRLDRLRIRHLRLLELVAATGSLSAAAQRQCISQPGATKMLQELESAFGCNLIERSTRGGQLSRAGDHALGRLRIALGALDAAGAGLAAQPEVPLVRVGMLPLVGVDALPGMVAAMSANGTLPRLAVREATVDGLLAMLVAGELDCVLGRLEAGADAQAMARFKVMPLWEERLAIAGATSNPLVRRRKVSRQMLRDANWVLPPHGSNTRRLFEQFFLDAGTMPPEPDIESISFHTNLSLVAGSGLLTMAPASAIRRYETLSMVRAVRMETPFPAGHMVFITLHELANSPGVALIEQAMLAWAREASPVPTGTPQRPDPPGRVASRADNQ